jgi:peroxiredoxin
VNMRTNLLSFIFLFGTLFSTHAQEGKGYNIAVKIKGFDQGELFLGYPFGEKKYLQDTTTANKEGVYVFEGEKALTGGIYFIYAPDKVYFEIIVANQNFSITTDTADFVSNMEVNGSPENELFRDFRAFMNEKQIVARDINQKIESVPEEEQKALQEKIISISEEIEAYKERVVEEHPESLVAQIIKSSMDIRLPDDVAAGSQDERYQYYKAHYFDHLDLNDPRMLRTPFFHQKVMDYLDKLTVPHPDSIAKSAQEIIDRASANEETYRYWVVTLTNRYETSNLMGMDAVFVKLVDRYYLNGKAKWADEELIDKLRTRVEELKPNLIGKQAPPLPLNDISGNPRPLYKINSEYTVVYFYDPDCGHCKNKTPELQKAYENELKHNGIEVYAVNISTEEDKWNKFVNEHGLTFINVVDARGYRGYYDVKSTPKMYLLDRDKKIVAKQLDVAQVKDFVERHRKNVNE